MDGLEMIGARDTPLGVAGYANSRRVIEYLMNSFPEKQKKSMLHKAIGKLYQRTVEDHLEKCLSTRNAGLYWVSAVLIGSIFILCLMGRININDCS